jgi:hypothetical protein
LPCDPAVQFEGIYSKRNEYPHRWTLMAGQMFVSVPEVLRNKTQMEKK